MNCPDCGGAMWDNRANKRNPKSPDFKCKNAQCAKAVWEKPSASASSPAQSNGNGNGGSHSRALGPLYNDCLDFAKKACGHHFGASVTPADVIAATATLFIQAVKDGSPIRPVKPAPPPPPPPPPADVYDDDRDLPF